MKTSKIKTCLFNREWASPNGTIYYHTIELENGDSGSIGSKEKYPSKLAPGKELTYEIIPDGEYQGVPKYKIKPISEKQTYGSGGGGAKATSPTSVRTMCLAYAKDLAVAGLIHVDEILVQATTFYKWANEQQ
jgi:hypothetical protein